MCVCIKGRVVAGVEAQLMRFAGAAAWLQRDVVSPTFPFRWPRLITAHEKRWQWRHDPRGPIHYPASCTLPSPATRRFHRFKVTAARAGKRRVIKWGGEGKRNEDTDGPRGGVTLERKVWLINALNLWSIHEILSLLGVSKDTSARGETWMSNTLWSGQACVWNLSTQRIMTVANKK